MLLILIVTGSISTLYFFPSNHLFEEQDRKNKRRRKEGNYICEQLILNRVTELCFEFYGMTSSWSSPHPRSHRNRVCALVVVFLLVKSPSISSWLKQPTNQHFRRVYLSRRNEITSLARRVYFLFIVSCLSCGTIAANISQKLSFFSSVITAENIPKISEF